MCPNRVESTRRALEIFYEKNLIQYLTCIKHQKLNHLVVYETTS